jgi:hypothetical protein
MTAGILAQVSKGLGHTETEAADAVQKGMSSG